MSTQSIQQSYPIFNDIDGQPLEGGNIYIGTAGLAAQTNQITVYWDAALTTPATQPIRTTGGYPMNNGAPGTIYVGSDDYSITVNNKNNSTITSSLNVTERVNGGVVSVKNSSSGGVTRTLSDKLGEMVSVTDFGADPTGVADSTAAIQSAINASENVYFPAGTYNLVSTQGFISGDPNSRDPVLDIPANRYLYGDNATLVNASGSLFSPTMMIGRILGVDLDVGDRATYQPNNITIKGLKFQIATTGTLADSPLKISNAYGVKVEGCYIDKTYKNPANTNAVDGIFIADAWDIEISGNTIVDHGRNGIAVISGREMNISNNKISTTVVDSIQSIDLEYDTSVADGFLKNIVISGNICIDGGLQVVPFNGSPEIRNISFTNNTLEHSGAKVAIACAGNSSARAENIIVQGNAIKYQTNAIDEKAINCLWLTDSVINGNSILYDVKTTTQAAITLTSVLFSNIQGNNINNAHISVYILSVSGGTNTGLLLVNNNINQCTTGFYADGDNPIQVSKFDGNQFFDCVDDINLLCIGSTAYSFSIDNNTLYGKVRVSGNAQGYSISGNNGSGSTDIFLDVSGAYEPEYGTIDNNILASGLLIDIDYGTMSTAAKMRTVVRPFSITDMPATVSTTGMLGDIRTDGTYVYMCYATNTWKRMTLASF